MRTLTGFLILATLTVATALGASPGTTGFELFRTDGFARSSALAGSQIAVGGDVHSLFTNPAGLAEMRQPMGAVGFFKHVLDINSGNLAYARPVHAIGSVVGLGVTYFDYGKFDRADEYGQKQGEFGASDFLVTASAARGLRANLSGGVSLKYLNSTIDSYGASAIAADLGILFRTGYHDWDVGAGIYNLGFATSAFLEEKDDLPTTYRLGLSVPLEHLPVRFSFSGDYMEADDIRGAAGLEVSFSPNVQGRLGFNTIGIDQRVGLDRDALAGFSAGLGIHVSSLTFDYALTSQGEVGFLHRFMLGTSFPSGQIARD
ncbi:PorV/PorQ family protein [bacterium]|nr:PorV/PorQ family protein [bacterium]MBU1984023.1 PorV/PorQ family protein [bacterium]